MKRLSGFNLVELMVALAMATLLISALTSAYSTLYGGLFFSDNKIVLQQGMRYVMSTLKRDLQNAGVFGCFSFHNQAASSAYSVIGSSCSDEWCQYDSNSVGVKSYTLATLPPGLLMGRVESEVLRIQYGSSKVAYLAAFESAPCGGGSCLNILDQIEDLGFMI